MNHKTLLLIAASCMCTIVAAQTTPAQKPVTQIERQKGYGTLNTDPAKIAQLGPWARESRRKEWVAANPTPAPRASTVCHRFDETVVCNTY